MFGCCFQNCYMLSNIVEIWLSVLFFVCTLLEGGYKTNKKIAKRAKSQQDYVLSVYIILI